MNKFFFTRFVQRALYIALFGIFQFPFWIGLASGQTTYTTNRNLALPPAAPGTWGEQYNNNFQTLDASSIPRVTNATKPASPTANTVVVVTDAANGSTCTTGGGSFQNTCQWNGSTWTVIGGSGSGSVAVLDSSISFTADISPAQITANQNDYAGCVLASNTVCRITTDASRNITGFTDGADGKLLFLYNVGSFNVVLKNLVSSAASNQLTINADITIAPNQGIILQYDATSTKWRAASGISGGGAGQAADNDLTALAGFTSTGFPARTTTDTWAQRAMATASANNIIITNPLGIAGDPTFDVGPNVALTTRSFTTTTGDFDLGASTSFTLPKAAGAAPSAEGRCAQDTTAHRLKCNFGSGVVTLATLTDIQPLNANLTALAGLTGANNAVPIFTGVGAFTTGTLPSCADSAGQHLNYDTTTHAWSCGTSSTGGLSGLTTGKYLIATGATTTDTSGNLSQTGGVVNASAGFTVGTGPFLAMDTSAIAATDKTWTVLNFSGTVRPSTGAITAGHVLTTDANGLIIDGGVAGAGTWTDSSASTGTNKTIDVEGTGNTITTVSKLWLPTAGGTAAIPGLLWDTLASNAPTPVCTEGSTVTTLLTCSAAFTNNADGDNSLQQTFMLPSDWTGTIELRYKWFTTVTSGDVVWQAALMCRADAEVDDAVGFNTATATVDTAKGTTLQLNDATSASLTTTGCAAGELAHLKVFRNRAHASDTIANGATFVNLVGVEVTMRRAQ